MKVNEHTAILTPRVVLVPYEARHVAKYHRWMSDTEIQAATASEPLSLEEEYENQESWRQAQDKLTFILCRPVTQRGAIDGRVTAGEVDGEEAMLGDVNFFLYPYDGDEDGDEERKEEQGQRQRQRDLIGEVDVMVAEGEWRGKGVGFAAVTALMNYLYRHLDGILEEHVRGNGPAQGGPSTSSSRPRLRSLVAKIKEGNRKSIALFGRVGFVQRGGVNYFGELEMVLDDFEGFMSRVLEEREKGEGDEGSWGRELAGEYQEVVYSRM
ncbi:hypothetical protein SODALDRAFT_305158 [Sodiomyces alkalinus F11]|uniref:N-acetyltransferase domain-containing protein n=1 Tax=Sodiomyces alkalinus (strain CBS 110278 / VKM F-3762 / F11) TaxID=1314773 RepID=A0A3N2Q8Y4_SODAK|nr:hypothetical protein SODALDRAFT_305158 [Sodiomyces alkalinus F11]ROT43233.1 hypothetical protein SODALDRAFT_305158 [Sodiomyces alkalinus F11]